MCKSLVSSFLKFTSPLQESSERFTDQNIQTQHSCTRFQVAESFPHIVDDMKVQLFFYFLVGIPQPRVCVRVNTVDLHIANSLAGSQRSPACVRCAGRAVRLAAFQALHQKLEDSGLRETSKLPRTGARARPLPFSEHLPLKRFMEKPAELGA